MDEEESSGRCQIRECPAGGSDNGWSSNKTLTVVHDRVTMIFING